jgi:hypothetical protein
LESKRPTRWILFALLGTNYRALHETVLFYCAQQRSTIIWRAHKYLESQIIPTGILISSYCNS